MSFITDLHIHSPHSRATSRNLSFEMLDMWARIKGVDIVGTGDINHPARRAEIEEKLQDDATGLYILRIEFRTQTGLPVAGAPDSAVAFMLTGEISTIYQTGQQNPQGASHCLSCRPGRPSQVQTKIHARSK
ncbi:MAG: hypothetical protein GF398_08620 [Chitinivibrionales bacterium]|nr:hypothetical protein [Chitinivibrionales bacterium]